MTATRNNRCTRLRLFRSKNESFVIGTGNEAVRVTIEKLYPTKAVVVVEAPSHIQVNREELLSGEESCS